MAGKRGNGAGTIRKRPDGGREARILFSDGQRLNRYGKTRQEASRRLAEALRNHEQGIEVSSKRQTVTRI